MASDPSEPDSMAAQPFKGRRVIVGVTGGIAAYKTCHVVSRLAQSGAEVTVCMSDGATRFVTALTFQALSGRAVYTSQWEHVEAHDPQHIDLARRCDVALVAPASMNCLARLAAGMADDIVTLVLSAIDRSKTPVLLAPSMNAQMWDQPATQRNLKTLKADGYRFIPPGEGWQACRTEGVGRMAEPEELLAEVKSAILA